MTDVAADTADATIPGFPMPRAAGCPFAPPPEMMRLHAEQPVSRVRLWTAARPGSSPATTPADPVRRRAPEHRPEAARLPALQRMGARLALAARPPDERLVRPETLADLPQMAPTLHGALKRAGLLRRHGRGE